MAAIKSYTDISQSKKLAKILPIESADMEYMFLKKDSSKVSNIPFVKDDEEPEWPNDGSYDFIPCWSLAALLEQFEDTAGLSKDYGLWFCYDNRKSYCTKHYDNPVDACYELILKLNELNLL